MKRSITLSVVFLSIVLVITCCGVGVISAAPQFKDKRGFTKKLSDAEVECQSGEQFMEMGNYNEAIEHFQNAVSLDPDYTEAWSFLGTSYMKLKMFNESIEAFLKAFELDPEDKSLIASLGYDYLNIGDLDNAEKYYTMLTEEDYLDYNGNIHLGFIAKQRNEIDSAIVYYQRALEAKPNDAVTIGSIASLYGDKGDKAKEIEYMERAVEADSTNYTMLQKLATTYFSAKEYGKAVPVLRSLIEVYPDNAPFHQRLGFSISESGGDYKEAADELEKANLLSGGNSFNYALLAKIFNENREYDKAMKAAQAGLKLGGGKEAFLRYQLGEALSKKIMYEEAVVQFQKVINLNVAPWSTSAKKQLDRQYVLIKRLKAQKEQEKYE